jgi:hypothetical protein
MEPTTVDMAFLRGSTGNSAIPYALILSGGRQMSLLRAKQGLLMFCLVALAACGGSTESIGAGPTRLKFSGRSNSEFRFELENGSADTIRFRGWPRSLSIPMPALSAFATSCHSDSSGDINGFSIEQGRQPPLIEVPSKTRIHFAIAKNSFATLRGTQCQLRLKLDDGSNLDSDEFQL